MPEHVQTLIRWHAFSTCVRPLMMMLKKKLLLVVKVMLHLQDLQLIAHFSEFPFEGGRAFHSLRTINDVPSAFDIPDPSRSAFLLLLRRFSVDFRGFSMCVEFLLRSMHLLLSLRENGFIGS